MDNTENIVNVRELQVNGKFFDWFLQKDHIYIGPGHTENFMNYAEVFIETDYHNPFSSLLVSEAVAYQKYQDYVQNNLNFQRQIKTQLKDKVLGCTCNNIKFCHGQILLNILNPNKQKNE